MKLNDFLDKSKKPYTRIQNTKTISFVNETRETELNQQIADLELEVGRLHDMEDLYTQMLSRVAVLEEHTQDSQFREDQLNEKITFLEADVERGEQIKQERNEIEDSLKSFKAQYSAQENTLDLAQKTNLSLTNNYQIIQSQVVGLQNENADLLELSKTATQQSVDNQHELNDIKTQFTEISKVFSSTQVKYTQETKKNSELSRDLSHWQRVANILQEEKEELEKTRKAIKAWAEAVDSDYQNSTEIGRVNKSEIQKMRKVISTMNEQIAQLMDENEYLVEKNAFLLDEIAAPKHASMGAIERLEGFKLPSNMSFKGKHYLGNGVPTLLKRIKGADDDII